MSVGSWQKHYFPFLWSNRGRLNPVHVPAADSDAEGHIRSNFAPKPQQYTWHTPFNGLEFPSPSAFCFFLLESKSGLFICLHYLVYFLLRSISNGWSVAQRHNRDTANSWEEIRVECQQGKITLGFLSAVHPTDLRACNCNEISGEGSQRED